MTVEQDKEKGEVAPAASSGGGTRRKSTTRRTPRAATGAKTGKAKGPGTRARSAAKQATGARSARGGGAKGKKASTRKASAAVKETSRPGPTPLPRMLSKFRQEIAPTLMKEFEYTSPMQVPRLSKIVLNIGIGAEAIENARAIESATNDLSLIAGQHPVTTRARKSIAGFKVREGMPMGLTVTLRGARMYEFFDRLVSSALPRIRDFRGISRESFDGRGNFALGISEQVIFPEIDYNSIDRIRGLQVVIVTTAPTDREGLRLLELLGVPFARSDADAAAA